MAEPKTSGRPALVALARSYVPEWRFDEKNPDSGSAVALLVDDMLLESEKRLGRAIGKYRIQYLNLFDRLREEPSESAKSFVRFTQAAGMDDPVHVPRGTRLYAEEKGRRLVFETTHAITATQAELVSVAVTDGATDRIVRLLDKGAPGASEGSFTAFDLSGESEAEHRLLLGFDGAFDALEDLELLLRVRTPDPEKLDGAIETLCRKELRYSLLEPEGERVFRTVERQGDAIRLSLPGCTPQKVELGGRERYVLCVRAPGPLDLELCGAQLSFAGEALPPDEVRCAGVTQNAGRFLPFGGPMEIYAECGIECRQAFARRGARVAMRFSLGFETVERKLPEAVSDIDYKLLMKGPREAPRLEPMQVRADYALFEYRSVRGWRRLLEEEHAALLFNGSTEGAVECSFLLPRDIAEEDGEPRLRLRLLRADNLYSMPCVQLCPVITGLSFSYRYEEDSLPPDYACTRNNFETAEVTGAIASRRAFPVFYNNECGRTAMYLGFDLPPRGMPLSLYFEVENDEDAALDYTAEYLSPDGFAQLQAVDNTGGLLYAGTLLLPVPDDIVKKELFGRECWWLRLVLRRQPSGQLPLVREVLTNMARVENRRSSSEVFYLADPDAPLGIALAEQNLVSLEVWVNEEDGNPENAENWVRWNRRIGRGQQGRYCGVDLAAGTVEFEKNAFAPYPLKEGGPAVRVDYRSYQGAAANVGPDTITVLEESVRYISSATNPMAAYGGCDGHTEEAYAASVRNLLRTRGRAVTEQDFFDLISSVSYGVRRIRVLPGVTPLGQRDERAITVALLIEEYEKGGHIFSAVRDTIREKLLASSGILPQGRTLMLCQPRFVRFSVRVWLECGPDGDPYELQQQTLADIRAFLDPLTGGYDGDGWEIGTLPTRPQLLAWLGQRRPGILIARMALSARSRGREYPVDEKLAAAVQSPFAMAVNGEHIVYVNLRDRRE